MTVIGVEACVIHEERIKTMADQMDPVVGPRLVADLALTGVDYAKALQELAALRESQKETLRDVDVLLTPTTPIPALPVEVVDETLESYLAYAQKYLANTSIGNKLDLCGLSLPCGFTEKGLPIGLLLNAKPFDEALVLRAGQAYEQATDWRSRHPDLSWTD
jgi:aspartyl-tRNA(Asn)/glutamyl-tRNA(Gln) amidotransferase subunit A